MKHYVVIFFLALPFIQSPTIQAQTIDLDLPSSLQLGAKAGFTASKIVGGVNTYFAPRLMVGIWGLHPSPFLEVMDFKAEILLSGHGARDATRREAKGRWSYTYLSVPLMASFRPFETEKLRFDAGLQPNFLLRARYRDQNEVFNITQETKTLDVSLVLGGSYQIKEEWFVDWRLALAFFNHSKRDWTSDRYLNQAVQVGVGKVIVKE